MILLLIQSCSFKSSIASETQENSIEYSFELDSVQILGSDRDETLTDLAQNKSGDFVVVGTTDGAIDGYSNRLLDAFVAKYDNQGKKLWVVRFGTPQDDFGTAVAIDESGAVWVSGDTYGDMEGNLNKGERDGFLAKFSSSGAQQWIVHISTEVIEKARGLAVDSRGVATVVGTTYGEFPGFSNEGKSREAWITQIDRSGNKLWLRQFGSDQADTAVDVSVDDVGNSTICGYTDGVIGQKFFGVRDAFIGKFTSNGEKSWIYQFGTATNDVCYGQWVNEAGEIFAVGVTDGSISDNTNFGYQDGWILKLSQQGELLWATQVGSAGVDGLAKVVTNEAGMVIVGGVTTGDFVDPSTGSGLDAVLYLFDSSGRKVMNKTFGTKSNDAVNGVAIKSAQEILVVGTSGEGVFDTVGLGELDVFVALFKVLTERK